MAQSHGSVSSADPEDAPEEESPLENVVRFRVAGDSCVQEGQRTSERISRWLDPSTCDQFFSGGRSRGPILSRFAFVILCFILTRVKEFFGVAGLSYPGLYVSRWTG